ncbi:hypothetical protein FDP41_008756 [Naegleria fowleri]|uniref:Uncharacterized protein n=1 Tax=Naegleria fowleri TaxID=5763 RepID=A0A6A5BFU7_NAEFO|nr:uncharacterized protein FDP41_008756 [Naegleria fowleri]KAF0972904.1 hypothetical protein FDP41_008756 [Naegleria fowleri]CAG4711934.1 unnamed protein product [Naegleria fowleri]
MSKLQQRLDHLVKSYYDSDLKITHTKYEETCDRLGLAKKDFLHDISLYRDKVSSPNTLSISMIQEMVQQEYMKILPKEEAENLKKRKQQLKEKRDLKRKKAFQQDRVCDKCGNSEFFYIGARSCDNGELIFPSGRQIEGYLPVLPSICDSDGVMMYLCLECGVPFGFNSAEVKRILAEREQERYPPEQDDDVDEDDDENEENSGGSEEEDEE